MPKRPFRGSLALLAALSLASAAAADPATDGERARDDEIADLKQKLSTVVEEVEKLRAQVAAPEVPQELKSQNGFGPAAAKIYSIAHGLSIGGYVEGHYAYQDMGDNPTSNEVNLDREVLYLGYKFNDWIAWNSEIEFENASTEENGSVTVEFSTLDFLIRPDFNARIGVLLLPMGILNEVHEPPFYYGVFKPQVETSIIPTTWSEYGAGFFGRLGETVSYRVYVVSGMNAEGFESSGIREGRQGSSEALANDLAFVGRLEWEPLAGLSVGGSYYSGNSGQGQKLDINGAEFAMPKTPLSIFELHSIYRWQGLTARALYAQSHIGNSGQLSELFSDADHEQPVISRRLLGGYVEVAYDVMPLLSAGTEMSLEPFFRWEYCDTQNDVASGFTADRMFKQRIYVPGVQFKPIPNVVLKLDYRNVDDFAGKVGDQVDFGFGLVF
jgi:opacity protein-like surface antigen